MTNSGVRSPRSGSSSTPTERRAGGDGLVLDEPDAGDPWRAWIPTFDRWAPTYDDQLSDPWLDFEAAWAFTERALRAGLGGLEDRTVVDVGCGTGEFLRRIVEGGSDGVGVEPSAGMRAAARRKLPGTSVLDGHLAAIPIGDGRADAAIATYVVSHLAAAEQPPAIDELLRVVRGAGPIVVVDVPRADPDDLPRVREVLHAAGRDAQIEWFERGFGLDVAAWRGRLEAAGRQVIVEPLGPLLRGLAGLPGDLRWP
jgi:SAM-dependent methyltransferase